MEDPTNTRAAADGSALAFASLGGFSDVRGTGLVAQYLSRRDGQPRTNGWSTHAISPVQGPTSFAQVANGAVPLYYGEFAPDLSKGVLTTGWPLTNGAPNVLGVGNVYRRTDLLTSGPGAYDLLSNAIAPVGFFSLAVIAPRPAGASADFSHVLFESVAGLTADASSDQSQSKLYEWDNGTVRLAGVLPDGTPAAASLAGHGTGLTTPNALTPNTISRDGRRIFFTDPTTGVLGTDGTLYMRVDHISTVQISGSQPATYWWATPDGSQVFFTTSEALTGDDVNGTNDLYRYDVNAPAGAHLTLISVDNQPADDDGGNFIDGVIGGSDDGRYLYFLSKRQLMAGGPTLTGPDGIFLWHDGTLTFIGLLTDQTDIDRMTGRAWVADPTSARVAPDGRSLLFVSLNGAGLGGHDHGSCPENLGLGGCAETYLYQADSNTLTCVSCPASGPGTGNASPVISFLGGAAGHSSHLNHPLSDDGKRIFFTSEQALVPADHNGAVPDVYEYDVPTGSLHLISNGISPDGSYFLDASRSGSDVFFATSDRLTGWDIDDNYDIYDARERGGFPEPARPLACVASGCRGTLSSEEPAPVLGSTVITANQHLAHHRAKHCRKGKVHRRVHGKVRCVKAKRHRHHRRVGTSARRGGTR